jgi:hypothetical protein
MEQAISREDLARLRKLAQLPSEIRASQYAISITRLTILKSFCRDQAAACQFVAYLARKTLDRIQSGTGRRRRTDSPSDQSHLRMMGEALSLIDVWFQKPTEALRKQLWELMHAMRKEQNEHKSIPFGAVRQITDWELLLFEEALHCLLGREEEAGSLAYEMARDYAERSEGGAGSGLVTASLPLLQDITDFWMEWFGVDLASLETHPDSSRKKPESSSERKPASATRTAKPVSSGKAFTARQGQFLAFIHLYHKLHRQAPGELDMVRYFRVTPPTAHNMVVKLEELGLVTRQRGKARTVRVTVSEDRLPALEPVEGPPW